VEGLIESRQGSGTWVLRVPPQTPGAETAVARSQLAEKILADLAALRAKARAMPSCDDRPARVYRNLPAQSIGASGAAGTITRCLNRGNVRPWSFRLPATLVTYTPPWHLFHDHEYFAAISAG
jgi:hypothetical protein